MSDNEYLVKVEFTGTGYVRITAPNGDEVCDKITKGEGYDKQCIDDMRITDVEMVQIVSSQKCEEINED